MSERYLAELDRALRERGAPRRLRLRFVTEARDHLLEGQAGQRSVEFGDPDGLAQQIVDELASAAARRTALVAAVALAPAAAVYALLFLFSGTSPDILSARDEALGLSSAFVLLIAPQLSLAAGALALLRAFRRRGQTVVARAEVHVLVRRASTALASGAATVAALALYAYEYETGLAWWWRDVAYAAPLAVAPVLLGAALAVRWTARLRSAAPGQAGDVFADLPEARPLALSPWRFCLVFAAAVAALAFAGPAVAGAADEGLRNAIGEALAVVTGFATLGRFLGLRG
jgi:hypothetical protein